LNNFKTIISKTLEQKTDHKIRATIKLKLGFREMWRHDKIILKNLSNDLREIKEFVLGLSAKAQ